MLTFNVSAEMYLMYKLLKVSSEVCMHNIRNVFKEIFFKNTIITF